MCLENCPGNRCYGTVTTNPLRDQAAPCPTLIPFLRSLTAALVEAQDQGLGLANQGPETGKAARWSHISFCCQSGSCFAKVLMLQ